MDSYAAIEKKTGFRVPDLYRRMQADGVCSYGTSREEWRATWRTRSLLNPPALLAGPELDFKWMALDEMATWNAPSYWSPKNMFVPFGSTSAGDKYCWYPQWTVEDSTPIVLVWRDSSECQTLAPHFEAFLYREALKALTYRGLQSEDQYDDFSPSETQLVLRANVNVLRPYLRAAWVADLDSIVERQDREWRSEFGDRYVSRMSKAEFEERLSREIAFPRLGSTFRR